MANDLIRKAITIDDKCDFAYETLATLQVQRFVFAFPFALSYLELFTHKICINASDLRLRYILGLVSCRLYQELFSPFNEYPPFLKLFASTDLLHFNSIICICFVYYRIPYLLTFDSATLDNTP